jgi:hypothetical protein
LFGVKRAGFTGNALHDEACVFVNENTHRNVLGLWSLLGSSRVWHRLAV